MQMCQPMNRHAIFITLKLCVWFGFILFSAAGVNDKGNHLDTFHIHSVYAPKSLVASPGTQPKIDSNHHSSNNYYEELKSNFFS
jgi:hypothetical protein